MQKYLAYVIILSLYLMSCSDRESSDNSLFSDKAFTTSKSIKGSPRVLEKLGAPSLIKVIPKHNLLVFVEMIEGEYLGKVYSLDSLKYIKSFLKRGEGPNEQISAQTLQYVEDENMLYVSDLYKNRIFCYDVASLSNPRDISAPVKSIAPKTLNFTKALRLSKNKIINIKEDISSDTSAIVNVFDSTGNYISSFGKLPNVTKKYSREELLNAYSANINLGDDGNYIIVTYKHTDFIQLYNVNGSLVVQRHGPGKFMPEFDGEKRTEESKQAYRSLARMRNGEVYALYDGGKDDPKRGYHVNTILSFGDSLRPKAIYNLDTPILGFDVDWDKKIVYGMTHNIEGGIVIFKF